MFKPKQMAIIFSSVILLSLLLFSSSFFNQYKFKSEEGRELVAEAITAIDGYLKDETPVKEMHSAIKKVDNSLRLEYNDIDKTLFVKEHYTTPCLYASLDEQIDGGKKQELKKCKKSLNKLK